VMNLDFPDKHFDVVLCNHVYEHVPDSELLFNEIYRVLKDEGFCYLAAVNKLMLLETHYRVPFLSCFPQRAADLYLKALGKGTHYYENSRTVCGLKKLVRNFEIHDYTIKILRNPKFFFAEDLVPHNLMARSLLLFLAPQIYFLIPTYIWILKK
jgi:ubiquinone/menaquinone biosynthesis C-methylase UbiE